MKSRIRTLKSAIKKIRSMNYILGESYCCKGVLRQETMYSVYQVIDGVVMRQNSVFDGNGEEIIKFCNKMRNLKAFL